MHVLGRQTFSLAPVYVKEGRDRRSEGGKIEGTEGEREGGREGETEDWSEG